MLRIFGCVLLASLVWLGFTEDLDALDRVLRAGDHVSNYVTVGASGSLHSSWNHSSTHKTPADEDRRRLRRLPQ